MTKRGEKIMKQETSIMWLLTCVMWAISVSLAIAKVEFYQVMLPYSIGCFFFGSAMTFQFYETKKRKR